MGPGEASFYRRELLSTLDHLLFVLFVLSYLLSPSHLLTFLIRLTSQVQFGAPNKMPTRPLRFFLSAWFGLNFSNILVHALSGSVGTKGKGWSSGGLILDFVGQSYTPNRVHLLGVDFLIAGIQFLLVIIAFGNGAEGHRTLLGDDEESFSDDEEEVRPIKHSSRSDPYSQPIVNLRFRTVWNEIARGPEGSDGSNGMRGAEEGRSTAVSMV